MNKLPSDLQGIVDQINDKYTIIVTVYLDNCIKIGELLKDIKDRVPVGFSKFVNDYLPFSDSQAYRLMKITELKSLMKGKQPIKPEQLPFSVEALFELTKYPKSEVRKAIKEKRIIAGDSQRNIRTFMPTSKRKDSNSEKDFDYCMQNLIDRLSLGIEYMKQSVIPKISLDDKILDNFNDFLNSYKKILDYNRKVKK